jgi:hypothetical protein
LDAMGNRRVRRSSSTINILYCSILLH